MSSSTHNRNDSGRAFESFGLDDLDYDLPEELIAQTPSTVRHQSRLLVVNRETGELGHHHFEDLDQFLKPGDLIVVNDTRVVPSRLFAQRKSGGVVRLLLLRPQALNTHLWEAMVSPIKRLKVGETLTIVGTERNDFQISIHDIVLDHEGYKRLIVDLGKKENVYKILSEVGFAPLPPYIVREKPEGELPETDEGDEELEPENAIPKRTPEELEMERQVNSKRRFTDLERYQTVFANAPGAVAAPTAGLHFSPEVLAKLKNKGVDVKTITLHVGPGTFKPITSDIENHNIEPEVFSVPKETAVAVNLAKSEKRRVIAVGTTTLRALESAGASGVLEPVEAGSTSLYVKPGFQFKIIDCMITNFHLSKSSLLVLVATFAGKDLILKAYNEAIEKRYRFFSYGDSMLIL